MDIMDIMGTMDVFSNNKCRSNSEDPGPKGCRE